MASSRPIKHTDVPPIAPNLIPATLLSLIPKGFEAYVQYQLLNDILIIRVLNTDTEHTEVAIDATLYNPEEAGTRFPLFLFEKSTLATHKGINYSGKDNNCILNHNQLLYMILQHRFCFFKEKAKQDQKSFGHLLTGDIQAFKTFIEYVTPKAYNAINKVNNSLVILSPWDYNASTYDNPVLKSTPGSDQGLIGEILRLKLYKPNDKSLPTILKDLHIHPSSETSFSNSGKLVVKEYEDNNSLYRSTGYSESKDGFTTIFPPAQNIVARCKTHLISDALELVHPSTPLLGQECLYNKEKNIYEAKDNCMSEAIIVFSHINKETNRLVAGEIEASKSFVTQEVYTEESVVETFDTLFINKGEVLTSNSEYGIINNIFNSDKVLTTSETSVILDGISDESNSEKELTNDFTYDTINHKVTKYKVSEGIVIGLTISGEPVIINNTSEVKCLSITSVGFQGALKVRLRIRKRAGNARIDSSTGIKGVTKCKPNLGFIEIGNKIIKPDLIVGMNATKAKENTIVLAGAVLAVKLGYYKPNNHWGILNSLDEKMVNEAFNSLPEFKFINEFGKEEKVYIGIVYPRFTELAKTYGSKLKPLSFSFETGRFLAQNGNKSLQEFIWANYVSDITISCVQEFTKILNNIVDTDFPIISAKSITSGKVFDESDLIESQKQQFEIHSKIFDEDFNSKGFAISFKGCSPKHTPIIRFPSAKVLKTLVSQTPDGIYTYHAIIVRICNIIKYCMTDGTGKPRYSWVYDPINASSPRYTEEKAYLNEVHKLLFQGN